MFLVLLGIVAVWSMAALPVMGLLVAEGRRTARDGVNRRS